MLVIEVVIELVMLVIEVVNQATAL